MIRASFVRVLSRPPNTRDRTTKRATSSGVVRFSGASRLWHTKISAPELRSGTTLNTARRMRRPSGGPPAQFALRSRLVPPCWCLYRSMRTLPLTQRCSRWSANPVLYLYRNAVVWLQQFCPGDRSRVTHLSPGTAGGIEPLELSGQQVGLDGWAYHLPMAVTIYYHRRASFRCFR